MKIHLDQPTPTCPGRYIFQGQHSGCVEMIHVVWIHACMPELSPEAKKAIALVEIYGRTPFLGVMPTGRSIEKYKGRFSKRLDFV